MSSLNLNVNRPGGCQAKRQAAATAQATGLRLFPESGCVGSQDTVQQAFLPLLAGGGLRATWPMAGQPGRFPAPRWPWAGQATVFIAAAERVPVSGSDGLDREDRPLAPTALEKRSRGNGGNVRGPAYGKRGPSRLLASVSGFRVPRSEQTRRFDHIVEPSPRSWTRAGPCHLGEPSACVPQGWLGGLSPRPPPTA